MFISKTRSILTVALALLLSACSSDDGGGLPASRDSATVSGVAHDAPLLQAPVRIYAWDGGQKGALLGETTTDDRGDYQIAITSPDRPILIEAGRGGHYIEEASGVRVSLTGSQVMLAVAQYRSGEPITVQTTPLSTIAACYADYVVSRGSRVDEAINLANEKFSAIYGVQVTGDKPIDVTDPANRGFTLSDGFKYGFITAGISQFMATEVSAANGVTPHGASFATSINWATVGCGDIKADGRLNGFGYSGAGNTLTNLAFGSYAITPQVYRTLVAQRMLTFVGSDKNKTTLPVDGTMVTFANGLSTSTDDVWDGTPPDPVDNSGPAITANIAANTALSGTSTIGFSISDPVGVDSIQFFVDNNLVSIGQTSNPQLTIQTSLYLDGEHTVKVVATDIIGNESTEEVVYRFWNSGPAVTVTSDNRVANATHTMTGTFDSVAADIATITIDRPDNSNVGTAVISDGTWIATLNLSNGRNELVVNATDTLGNTSSLDVTVEVDLNAPQINPWNNRVRFTTYQGQYNLCQFGDLTLTSGSDTPVCLRSDRVSLNGASVNSNLSNLEFILMEVRVSDSFGAGVFTPVENITAEYKYVQNETQIFDWTPLTTRGANSNSDFFYLPLVTDFFGETFHQAPADTIHYITIRISDDVGNTSEVIYEIKLDVLVPALSMDSVNNADTLFNVPFASRTAVDNSALVQTTAFENVMGTPVYIEARPIGRSVVTHTHERMQRVNKVRIREETRLMYSGSPQSSATVYYNNSLRKTVTPAINYHGWQSPLSDSLPYNPAPVSLMTAPNGQSYCHQTNAQRSNRTDWHNFYVNPAGRYGCSYLEFKLNNHITYDRVQSLNYAGGDSTCPGGYPCNHIRQESTDYNVPTGNVTIKADGQIATLENGRYLIPTGATATIEYQVRMPNILHFNNAEVLNSSSVRDYGIYQYDRSTNWKIDMRMDLEIAGSAESTPNKMTIGNIIDRTIQR